MPNATRIQETDKFDLKSCEGAYVVLQRMTYGQSVERQAYMKMSLTSGRGKQFQGEMAMGSKQIQMFEFSVCIVDHNLEDENGNKLNLSSEVDFNRLDPRIGQEVAKLISDMNTFEDEEEKGNL